MWGEDRVRSSVPWRPSLLSTVTCMIAVMNLFQNLVPQVFSTSNNQPVSSIGSRADPGSSPGWRCYLIAKTSHRVMNLFQHPGGFSENVTYSHSELVSESRSFLLVTFSFSSDNGKPLNGQPVFLALTNPLPAIHNHVFRSADPETSSGWQRMVIPKTVPW